MMFDREVLKEIIKEQEVKTTEDFQELMRKMTKEVLEAIYDGEITDHLGYQRHEQRASIDGNSRNGYTEKKVRSNLGEINLDVPRDRYREIRFMSITDSGSSRSVIPAHVDHRFRFMSISDSGSSRSPK